MEVTTDKRKGHIYYAHALKSCDEGWGTQREIMKNIEIGGYTTPYFILKYQRKINQLRNALFQNSFVIFETTLLGVSVYFKIVLKSISK